jgi:protein-tyrosine phosphatase
MDVRGRAGYEESPFAAARRVLSWPACLNVRDLGGFRTEAGVSFPMRAFVRMDNPCRLTDTGTQALLSYGIRTLIDLRATYELAIDPPIFASLDPRAVLVEYVHRPFFEQDEWHSSPAAAQTLTAGMYIDMLESFKSRVGAIFHALADAPFGGVAFHCHSGKDRTGLISALVLRLAGVSASDVVEDYALSSDFLRDESAHWIEHGPGERAEREREIQKHLSRREVMDEVLRHLTD